MSLFIWKQDYAIDNGIVDDEHQKLFAMARHVLGLDLGPDKVDEFKGIVRGLYEYTSTHFEHEEDFMADINYPELEDHRRKHQEIVAEMNHYLSNDENLSELLADFKTLAVKWVFDHILEEDLKIQKYLNLS